jgi:hypothetical protein
MYKKKKYHELIQCIRFNNTLISRFNKDCQTIQMNLLKIKKECIVKSIITNVLLIL